MRRSMLAIAIATSTSALMVPQQMVSHQIMSPKMLRSTARTASPRFFLPAAPERPATAQIATRPLQEENSSQNHQINVARGLLLAAGAVWGTYPVVLRALYQANGPALPPLFVVAARFQITSVLFLVSTFARRYRNRSPSPNDSIPRRRRSGAAHIHAEADPSVVERRGLCRAAVELSVIGFCGNLMSVWGLSKVSALTSEVLLGMVHVFVPLLSVVVGGVGAVGLQTWQACSLSFAAVLIAATGGGGAGAGVAGVAAAGRMHGLASLLGASALYALGRVRCQHHIAVRRLDSFSLNALRVGGMGVLATLTLAADALRNPLGPSRAICSSLSLVSPAQWLLILVSCLASGFIGSSLQYRAQQTLSAAASQPFFAIQPLFACFWSFLFLSEPIAPSMLAAGTLMIGGALLASTESPEAATA